MCAPTCASKIVVELCTYVVVFFMLANVDKPAQLILLSMLANISFSKPCSVAKRIVLEVWQLRTFGNESNRSYVVGRQGFISNNPTASHQQTGKNTSTANSNSSLLTVKV